MCKTIRASGFRLNFAVVGGQRSGSTALADELASCDSVVVPSLELPVFEARFFSPGAVRTLKRYYPNQSLVFGLKRPNYLSSSAAAQNLAATFPSCLILIVLRDPLYRFLSAAYWYQFTGLIPVMRLSDVLSEVRGLGPAPLLAASAGNPFAQLLVDGLYVRHVRTYREYFPEPAVKIYYSDDLYDSGKRRSVATSVVQSLGVTNPRWLGDGRVRTNSGIYDPRRLRFLSWRPKTFSWEQMPRFDYIEHRLLRTPARSSISIAFHAVDRYLLSEVFRKDRAEDLTASDEAWLRSVYAEDLREAAGVFSVPDEWRSSYSLA